MRQLAIVLTALFVLVAAGSARAATFTVNSTADAVDATPGNGVCATATGVCTLRAAIQEANALAGADTINLPAGTYTLALAGTGENAAVTGDLDITSSLTLVGAGVGTTFVQGGATAGSAIDRVFEVFAGATVTISNLAIRNGNPGGQPGGGIRNRGNLLLSNVNITANSADDGGGIASTNGSTLTLSNVALSSNTTTHKGGAIFMDDSPSIVFTDVTMSNNTAADEGGAFHGAKTVPSMTRVTMTTNSSNKKGGAIYMSDSLGSIFSLTDVTMSGNTAADEGGAFFGDKTAVAMTRVTAGSNTTAKSGGGIYLKDTTSVSLTDVTISGNAAVDDGGGFFGDKLVGTMTRVIVSGNGANAGGGLYFKDGNTDLTFTDAAVSGNTATNNGGGIFIDGAGTMTFNRVTVDGNTCTNNRGGGVHFKGGNTSSLTNVTISGNSCSEGGGLHVEGGGVTLTNVTVTGNGATTGGGVNRTGGTLTIKNTIIANSSSGGNCSGTITSAGNNLDSANTCGLTGPTNLINTNPLLGPLVNNGGFTTTHALSVGSPAVDAATTVGAPATDQRGVARGFDGNGAPNNPVAGDYDIGAYESTASFPATVTKVVAVIADPFNGVTNPKFIPGAIAEYTLFVSNPGAAMSNNSVFVTDALNPNTALFVNDIGGAGSGPVAFQQGTPSSGLTYTFVALANAGDDLEFSNDGGTTWTYTPTAGANGCDPAVTHVRVNPKGIFASGLAGADPNFQLSFRICVK